MPSVYLETTIFSYLVAEPSRDLVVAAHQQLTHQWWQTARDHFDLYVSELVIAEIGAGDARMAARRLELARDIPIIGVNETVGVLTAEYDAHLGLTGRARIDTPHFAFAVAYEIDFLLTWNCAHIANGHIIRRLVDLNDRLQRPTPVIVTPEELLYRTDYEGELNS